MAELTYEGDEAKRAVNLVKHSLDLVKIGAFYWTGAIIAPDRRLEYGEFPFMAYERMSTLACMLAFTVRGRRYRVISLGSATPRERRKYGI